MVKEKPLSSPGDTWQSQMDYVVCSEGQIIPALTTQDPARTVEVLGAASEGHSASLLLLSNSFIADWEPEWGVSFGCYDHVFRT